MCTHFIGFSPKEPQRFISAVRIFGYPDFLHRIWDVRAACEILDTDIAVFAKGTSEDEPSFYPYTEDEFYSYQMRRLV